MTADMIPRRILKPGIWVYLDSDNEDQPDRRSACVLPLSFRSADIEQPDLDEAADDIVLDAKRAGFQIGDAVWTTWNWYHGQFSEYHGCELPACWEYSGIDVELSQILMKERE